MYSLEYIKKMNSEATKEAKEERLTPYVALINSDPEVRKCPNLADFIPDGWELVNTYFVDNSGFGAEGEPALTFYQFLEKVKLGYGYGIGEIGQFQVRINEYRKIRK